MRQAKHALDADDVAKTRHDGIAATNNRGKILAVTLLSLMGLTSGTVNE